MEDLETRVKQFRSMSLPGQPIGMHMGTAYLINDLWSEVQFLRGVLAECALAAGGAATPQCSRDFLAKIPEEIRSLRVTR